MGRIRIKIGDYVTWEKTNDLKPRYIYDDTKKIKHLDDADDAFETIVNSIIEHTLKNINNHRMISFHSIIQAHNLTSDTDSDQVKKTEEQNLSRKFRRFISKNEEWNVFESKSDRGGGYRLKDYTIIQCDRSHINTKLIVNNELIIQNNKIDSDNCINNSGISSEHSSMLPNSKAEILSLDNFSFDADLQILQIPIGMRLLPDNQDRELQVIDFLSYGHYQVFGEPKINQEILKTTISSICRYHTPEDMLVYVISGSDYEWQAFKNLPNIGGIVRYSDYKGMFIFKQIIWSELDKRSLMLSEGDFPNFKIKMPAIVIVISGNILKYCKNDNLDIEFLIHRIADLGKRCGIYLVYSSDSGKYISLGSIHDGAEIITDRKHFEDYVNNSDLSVPSPIPEGYAYIYEEQKPIHVFQIAMCIQGNDLIQRNENMRLLSEELDNKWKGKRPKQVLLPTNEFGSYARCCLFSDSLGEKRIYVNLGCNIIGSSINDANIIICDSKVSLAHARIVVTDNCIHISDLNSRSGTFVNGNRIHSETEIHDGDSIKFGDKEYVLHFLVGYLEIGQEKKGIVYGISTIGRNYTDINIVIRDSSVSLAHALIIASENRVAVQNLDKEGETFVNGDRICAETEIHDGDVLRFGKKDCIFHAFRNNTIENINATPSSKKKQACALIADKADLIGCCYPVIGGGVICTLTEDKGISLKYDFVSDSTTIYPEFISAVFRFYDDLDVIEYYELNQKSVLRFEINNYASSIKELQIEFQTESNRVVGSPYIVKLNKGDNYIDIPLSFYAKYKRDMKKIQNLCFVIKKASFVEPKGKILINNITFVI